MGGARDKSRLVTVTVTALSQILRISKMFRQLVSQKILSAGGRRAFSSSFCRFKDPWLLPNTPAHEAATQTPPDIPPLTPLPRPNEQTETLRARLVYQSRKRGTLESDLLLSTFANDHLMTMSEAELKEYDKVCAFICLHTSGS